MSTQYIAEQNHHAKNWDGRGTPPVTIRRIAGTKPVEIKRAARAQKRGDAAAAVIAK